jgi:hypothetical protein
MNKRWLITLIILAVILIVVYASESLSKNPISPVSNKQMPQKLTSINYENDSLSRADIGSGKVYLYAPNQTTTINENSWGFASEGDKIISGDYELILITENTAVQINVGQLQFNQSRIRSGGELRSFNLDKKNYAVVFYQYGGSNTDVVYVYQYSLANFSLVHFVTKNGKSQDFTETGLGGSLISNSDGSFTSKWYDNSRGYVMTNWKYNSEDNNFHEVSTLVSVNSL